MTAAQVHDYIHPDKECAISRRNFCVDWIVTVRILAYIAMSH